MLVMSTVLKKTNPYKTVLGYESVVGEDGRPMHKSWGNAIEFNEGAKKIGVDVMRWMYAKVMPTALLPFGYKPAAEIRRQFMLILWNSYRFFVTQANVAGWQPSKTDSPPSQQVLDKWILSRLNQTIKTVTSSLDQYYSAPATQALEKFVRDFSTWYIRRSRNRVGINSSDQHDKHLAYQTMYYCLVTLSKLLAPFIPYLADYLYTQLTGELSVHLTDWPKADQSLIHPLLEENMKKARELVEKIHSQRKSLGLKVRQPLASVTISGKKFGKPNLHQLILEETNIKKLNFTGKGKEFSVKLDTRLTPALKQEGWARDLVRQIQQARKQAGVAVDAPIDLTLPDWPKQYTRYIMDRTLAKSIKKSAKLQVK
jgi:isoleucyl-tRNA synthetase